MFKYEIRSRDLEGISLSGGYQEVYNYYKGLKKYIMSDKTTCYGDVMVRTKTVFCGLRFTVSIDTQYVSFKPEFKWKYIKYFSWLFLSIKIDPVYKDKFDKIVKDYLNKID